MRFYTTAGIIVIAALLCLPSGAQQAGSQAPKKKKLLAIGMAAGYQHDSISHALSSLETWGKETGLWDTYIRTDVQLITKQPLKNNAKNLDYFDAIAFYTTGELPLTDDQKADLLKFVREDGKGFIGLHSAGDTLYQWPEYGEMLGGYFDHHPWNTFQAPVMVEDREHPATQHLPKRIVVHDEIYQYKNWSRDKVRVLMRLDESAINLKQPNLHRTDNDFAVTWVKGYGKGRVFATSLGHREEVYDMPQIKKMFVEAVKWTMGLTNGHTNTHPKKTATD